MPIFEYRCDACGEQFEKLVRRDTEVECPKCTSHQLSQQLSTFSAHANGAPAQRQSAAPMCPGGMCQSPGICGRN
jgi:putative FmdB family regulatory protein